MAEQSLWQQLTAGLADAVSDIREKVVEEPMWGRVVTERAEAAEWPQALEKQEVTQGLDGQILDPEVAPGRDASTGLRLEYGTILEEQAMRAGREDASPEWPQAKEPGSLREAIEHSREREAGQDIER